MVCRTMLKSFVTSLLWFWSSQMPGVRVMDKDSQRQESVKGSFP